MLRRRTDPESTEQIRARRDTRSACAGDSGRTRGAGSRSGVTSADAAAKRARFVERTDPIEPQREAPVEVEAFTITGYPTELPDFDIPPALRRGSVSPGDTLAGRYIVDSQVDHAGMGLVYKARDLHRVRAGAPTPWVALKIAAASEGGTATTSPHLRQEFLKLLQLAHPNIVSVYDYDSDGGLDFLVMEWLEGGTLDELLANNASQVIPVDVAEDIICGIARALAAAHEQGIVHGDVKPSNVFLADRRNRRTVKLFDFGSSAPGIADGEAEAYWATRAYASCSVLQGVTPESPDDVYALGVTAYRLLTGQRPFGELDADEAQQRGLAPAPLTGDAARYWPAVREALCFDRVERPRDAAEFLQRFLSAAIEPTRAPQRRHDNHAAYGAVVVAALIALVIWLAGPAGSSKQDIEAELAKANRALAAGQLTAPAERNAFTHYSSVLEMSPGNEAARRGLERIADEFLARAVNALAADRPDAAVAYLADAKRVAPTNLGIAIADDMIAAYGKDLLVRTREVAQYDIDQAERMLTQAGNLLPENDSALVSMRQELASYRLDAVLAPLLDGIDDRILAERLMLPRGDSALDLLRQARGMAPDDPRVALAGNRIVSALIFQALFAISNDKLDDAQQFIDAAGSLDVKHIALSRAQYELAKAQNAAVRRGINRRQSPR